MTTHLRDVVHAAVTRLEPDGFFPSDASESLREAVAGHPLTAHLPDHPKDLFGPWGELPSVTQTVFRRSTEAEISRVMAYHPQGRIWPSLVGAYYSGEDLLRRFKVPEKVLSVGDRVAGLGWTGPGNLRERIYDSRRARAWKGKGRLSLEDLLGAFDRRPRWLLGDFATGVRVDPRCRGFHHDRDRNIVFGYLIGVDLIPTPEGVWCIEANLSTAFNKERRAVFNPEPAVEALFRTADDLGSRHIRWHDQQWSGMEKWLLEELTNLGSATGITLDLREGYRFPRRGKVPSGIQAPTKYVTSPLELPENTFVLRRNFYSVGTDYVLSDKGPFTRGVASQLANEKDDRVRVPQMSSDPGEVLSPPSDGLPNLVYKYPDSSKGKGVFFLKVDTAEEAGNIARGLDQDTGERPGLFQPFVCPRILPGGRVYDVRCELLITPMEATHVLSIRREAMKSLPQQLEKGLVRQAGVFTSNLATGGRFWPLDPGEEEEIRGAALAIGEALVRELNHTFETSE